MGLKESNKTQQSQVCIFFGPALIDTEPTTLTLRKLPRNLFFFPSSAHSFYSSLTLSLNITSQKTSLKHHVPCLAKSLNNKEPVMYSRLITKVSIVNIID